MEDLFVDVDQAIAAHPQFAHSESIIARNVARFRLGLMVLGRYVRQAAQFEPLTRLADGRIWPVLLDPVLRNAFERDLVALRAGDDPIGHLRAAPTCCHKPRTMVSARVNG